MMKKILTLVLVSALGGALALISYKAFLEEDQIIAQQEAQSIPRFIPTSFSPTTKYVSAEAPDFVEAAEKTINSVVHVKNTAKASNNYTSFESFFSRRRVEPIVGTGSGVIISSDGYIITNNHVIDNAESISITTNDNKIYEAELIGTDEETDIALLKIDANEDLPYTTFGDSDTSRIGEWVLAVGNPFNLTSTVTAGIISAKSRDLGGRNSRSQSFIQTDAAVNPGNSGGALVNTNGDLIGINTAITSQTGSYVGYSFAVPSNIARKVVEDILEYGNVQNGILGIYPRPLNSIVAKELGIDQTEGIYVTEVDPYSGAGKAGLKEGDIITKLDNVKVSKSSDLRGFLSSKRPDDIINLTIDRDGSKKVIPVTLTRDTSKIEILEMQLVNISEKAKKDYNISGVIIADTENYNLYRNYGIRSNYIITKINDKRINSVSDVFDLKEKYGNDFEDEIYSFEVLDRNFDKREIIIK